MRHAASSHNVSVRHTFTSMDLNPFWSEMSLTGLTYFIVDVSGHLGMMFEGLSTM